MRGMGVLAPGTKDHGIGRLRRGYRLRLSTARPGWSFVLMTRGIVIELLRFQEGVQGLVRQFVQCV